MTGSPNKLVFHADGKLSIRIAGKWRYAVSQLTRTEYMALPYEIKKRLLLFEFQTGRQSIQDTPVIVSRRDSILGSRPKGHIL
ncbi:MAG TPA: hypothetical protein VN957_26695 [Chthoniobacterales bacterium]|jgi:hypothetical protein|nr:hypothetical protein [Chthoniobacterales bacterium]